MELAFTLAKNSTKPNPFEIIPLQTSRKENNWKTEEALARAAVTVETERIILDVYDDDDYLAQFLLEREIFQTKLVGDKNAFSVHRQVV